jgi:hypothetical protein
MQQRVAIARALAYDPVSLPGPRDQITTKETREFARLRTEVSRLVRGDGEPAAPQSVKHA